MKKLVLTYGILLLTGHLIAWWLFWYSPLHIPQFIGNTPISIPGLVLIGIILTILIFAEKKLLGINPESTILKLSIFGFIISFIAEFVFQAIRFPFLNADNFSERLHYFLLGTIGVSLFSFALAFLVAFQLKTHKTNWLILLIILFLLTVNLIHYLYPLISN